VVKIFKKVLTQFRISRQKVLFRDNIMQRLRFPLFGLIVFGGVALGLVALVLAGNLAEQPTNSPASLQPSAATHETQTGLQELIEFRNADEITTPIETVSSAPPTGRVAPQDAFVRISAQSGGGYPPPQQPRDIKS